jgi:outer membrane protein assembly factor BamC
VNHLTKLAALALSLTLAACSSLEGDKVDYKSSTTKKTPELAVPPDLTQLTRDSRYATPGTTVTASSYQTAGQSAPTASVAVKSIGDVRIERAGTQRWLVVDRPADKLWDTIKDFWQENGLLLTMDQPSLGIMETDWAENRAKLPQDFIRGTLGKIFDPLYSTGELDKYRTRLERNAAGGTEIYISHRGMVEVYGDLQGGQPVGNPMGGRTIWQPRAVDPELEAEFLSRLMVKLGVPQEQAKSLEAAVQTKLSSHIASVDGRSVVVIDEGFDRAWRRVGLSLDRTGFTVEDRDRVQGTYFVRYVDPTIDKSEPGFFSKLFGNTAKVGTPQKFRIVVKGQGESTTVSVLNANGEPESSDNGQRILKVLVDDLK